MTRIPFFGILVAVLVTSGDSGQLTADRRTYAIDDKEVTDAAKPTARLTDGATRSNYSASPGCGLV